MAQMKLEFTINLYNEKAYNAEFGVLQPYLIQYNFVDIFEDSISLKKIIESLVKKMKIDENNSTYYLTNLYQLLWGKYFNDDIIYSIITCYDNILDTSLFVLEEQFEISRMPISLDINPFGMGDGVGICEGIKFFFHTKEKDIHNRPHIHCKYSGEEFRILLENLEIMDKPFKNNSKTKLALKKVKDNQEQLINYWKKVVIKGEKIKFNMVL